jgi:ribosome-binding factor A
MKSFSRTARVADLIHRLLAGIIRNDFKDPRVGMITVSSVIVTPDLKHAKIYVTVLEIEKVPETLKILNDASGFFRSSLAKELELRVIPKPFFVFDDSVIRGNRISSILESCIPNDA